MATYVVDSKGSKGKNARAYSDNHKHSGDVMKDGDVLQNEKTIDRGNAESETMERMADKRAEGITESNGETDYVGSKGSASQQRKGKNGELEMGTEKHTEYRTKYSTFGGRSPFDGDPRFGRGCGRTRGR